MTATLPVGARFRQPRYLAIDIDLKTGGFASPSHNGFALSRVQFSRPPAECTICLHERTASLTDNNVTQCMPAHSPATNI